MGNLQPNVGERYELNKAIFTLMDVESEIKSEMNYNTFKDDYGQFAVVMRYMDVGWACQNCYYRIVWTRFKRLFPHGCVNTANLIERMWHSINYTILRRKVNLRLDELVLTITGVSNLNRERMGV